MRIAYFGFAANPPHLGHLKVIEWLAERYDKVLIGPSAAHAFGKQLPSISVRKPWCEALLSQSPAVNVELTFIEEQLVITGPVYSYNVLVELQKLYPSATLNLAIGPDNAEPDTWNKFYRADDIIRDFGLIVAPNMGNDKRSTQIRAMLSEGCSYEELAAVATPAVAALLIHQ